jgi:hypothetical protein
MKLNERCIRANSFFFRVVFYNSHELSGMKSCKIMSLFTWIENRFLEFKSTLLRNIFFDTLLVKDFYHVISVKNYIEIYNNKNVVEIPMVLPHGLGISRDKLCSIVSGLSYISEQRKIIIKEKISKYEEEVCCLCLEEFEKSFSMVFTPCCFNTFCVKCCSSMSKGGHCKCFFCKELLDYNKGPIFIRLKPSEGLYLKDFVPDYTENKKYIIFSERDVFKNKGQEDNILTLDYKKVNHLEKYLYGTDCIIFISKIPENVKERLCYYTFNKNLKIYEM